MKSYILFLSFCPLLAFSCNSKTNQHNSSNTNSPAINENIFIKGDPENENHSLPNQRLKRSEIISCSFKKEALFGTWTTSNDNPACDFKLDAKEFFFCDYDGEGSRLYKIEKDTLFLDNPYLMFKGLILKATGDTLMIQWQQNKKPEILLRWQDNPLPDALNLSLD